MRSVQNLPTLHGYIFCTTQHFTAKIGNFTKFTILFSEIPFLFLNQNPLYNAKVHWGSEECFGAGGKTIKVLRKVLRYLRNVKKSIKKSLTLLTRNMKESRELTGRYATKSAENDLLTPPLTKLFNFVEQYWQHNDIQCY